MKIFGQLEDACVEQKATDPVANTQGRVWDNTVSGKTMHDNGTVKRAFIKNDDKAIIGNSGTESNNIRLNRAAAEVLQLVQGDDVTAEGSQSTDLAQISAKIESFANFAALPAFGNVGRLAYTLDTKLLYQDDGTAWVIQPKDSGIVANRVVIADSNGNLTSENGLAVTRGGTGAITATAGFDNLAPTTTKGDIIVNNGTDNVRLAVGANGKILTADSAQTEGVAWSDPQAALPNNRITNGNYTISVGAGALTINLKNYTATGDPSPSDPVKVGFANGTFESIESALTLTVPSGATLGHAASADHYVYVYLVRNASSDVRLGVSSLLLDESKSYNVTTLDTSSDSNNVLYGTSGSGKYIKLLGRMLSNQSVAGVWGNLPNPKTITPFLPQTICAVYETTAALSFATASSTIINYSTKVIDTLNCVTVGAGWNFVAPVDGFYNVNAAIRSTSTTFSNDLYVMEIFKNSSGFRVIDDPYVQSTPTQILGVRGEAVIWLLAGDSIDVRITTPTSNTTITTSGLARENYINITYLGPSN